MLNTGKNELLLELVIVILNLTGISKLEKVNLKEQQARVFGLV